MNPARDIREKGRVRSVRPTPSRSTKHAFTLLELIIAVSIFAMVLAAINGVFYGAMRLQRKSSQAVEESLPLQQTIVLLKRDLQGIVPPGGVLSGAFQSGASSGSTLGSTVPPGSTTFSTCTGVIDETSPWADVQ